MSRDASRRPRWITAARRATRLSLLLPVVLLGMAGCDDILPPDDDFPDQADIRVINGAADEIRVRVDGDAIGGATPAGSFSARISLAEGADQVRIEPTGASSLTGSATINLPSNGLGSGLGPTSILATSTPGGVIEALLVDDTDNIGQPGVGRLRVIHAASGHRELDIWYSNANETTLTRIQPTIDYGDVSDFVETTGSVAWRIVVTPRMVPTPGEDPLAQALVMLDFSIGNQSAATYVIGEAGAGAVRIVERPWP